MNHSPTQSSTRQNARRMRKSLTDAELKLWNELRAHRLMGLSFRRQMPIAGYIVDFACPREKIIIELDGAGHSEDYQIRKDGLRDRTLSDLGWTVLRFPNEDVMFRIDDVCSHIIRTVGVGVFEKY